MRTLVNRLLNFKSFRYLISGGSATAVDVYVYYICLHYIYISKDIYLGIVTAPIACFITSYSAGFVTNFTISKFFVFKTSTMRTRYQLFRYFLVAFLGFVLNYFFMKILIALEVYPTVARLMAVTIIAGISYMLHQKFTFKIKPEK